MTQKELRKKMNEKVRRFYKDNKDRKIKKTLYDDKNYKVTIEKVFTDKGEIEERKILTIIQEDGIQNNIIFVDYEDIKKIVLEVM